MALSKKTPMRSSQTEFVSHRSNVQGEIKATSDFYWPEQKCPHEQPQTKFGPSTLKS